ncbi:MAG TPA: GNAT family N-acetyltransferase [Rhodospirillaceae bacterium]|nr:GNAT family N-acetyltransferase [Rhodospirillaceae bacterium]
MEPIEPEAAFWAAGEETGCLRAEPGALALDTAHLRLRPMRADDAQTIFPLLNDWEMAKNTASIPFPYRLEDAQGFIAKVASETAAGRALVFAIEERISGQMIGCVGATVAGDIAEVGYWIGRDCWGRGYATEALRRCLRLLFDGGRVSMAWASVMPENQASRRVLEKAGLTFDQRKAVPLSARGITAELDYLSILRVDWERGRSLRPVLLVAAAALLDVDGRVLLAQRPQGKSMAGQWEFPGGKLQPGETPEAALIRELQEELGINVGLSCLAPLCFASHDYDHFHLLMPLFACRQWRGHPQGREGQRLAWVSPAMLSQYLMPPADLPLVAMLRDWL